jgi:uncharacterized GH25 family protein
LNAYRLLAVAALLGAAPPLLAHDLWIEPTTFSPTPGQIVGVRLRVGMNLAGDPVPRYAEFVRQFIVTRGVERKPIPGREGADPAGLLRVGSPGLQVIGYYSKPSFIELPADKFNPYLSDEGLDSIIALRDLRKQSGAPARELYSRCAKSLVLSGSVDPTEGDRALGFPLELIAERNPYALRAGEDLPVRLLWQGEPLEGALVVAINRVNPSERRALRSDHEGRVRFRLDPGRMWLVKAVHMVPAPAGGEADWQSFWASLTFEPRAAD